MYPSVLRCIYKYVTHIYVTMPLMSRSSVLRIAVYGLIDVSNIVRRA